MISYRDGLLVFEGDAGEMETRLGAAPFSTEPDFDFTSATSMASMNPSTFTSSRKFVWDKA